jgi:hypothetical protein
MQDADVNTEYVKNVKHDDKGKNIYSSENRRQS